ncbi:hypothetical protein BV372_34860 [Nostoc sp. T09]|uniref:hypothetical protein n=1 Tax=Nostoc sp. T09 TaxID=1932621 RepID=UPI000A3C3CD5|nr:hypothetical protein [Nostoc sp. T09]OUL17662.1 hypothetical protein BV372_34860 [Nostoc sp. T09]
MTHEYNKYDLDEICKQLQYIVYDVSQSEFEKLELEGENLQDTLDIQLLHCKIEKLALQLGVDVPTFLKLAIEMYSHAFGDISLGKEIVLVDERNNLVKEIAI